MGKIKKFFQKTGVAIAALAISIIGAVNIGALRAPAETAGFGTEILTIAGGITILGVVMIGAGVAKLITDSKEKKEIGMQKNPELEKPKQTVNEFFNGSKNTSGNSNQTNAQAIGEKIGQGAEKIGEKISEGANKLGIEIGKIFDNQQKPNSSANPYSSTYNSGRNPYSSKDRMSAGYGGRYNGQNYNPSMTGDVRNAKPVNNTGYYTGQNNGRNGNSGYGRNGGAGGSGGYSGNNQNNRTGNYNYGYNQNGNRPNTGYNQSNNGYNRNGNGQNSSYNQNNNRQNNGYNQNQYNSGYNQNVQYGGGPNNKPSNNSNNQNVQYGNYQNNRPTNTPNTSGLEESAKTNYFDNEPGSSSYRSGPLKKEKI
ncbi:MAG: hypothetical protein IKP88_14365 [Lachnospiraceae bacterium]|nr:hypothetical protein [Lachnospiraceae bacterium]